MKILVLAEHDNQQLKNATLHAITAAKALGNDIDVLLAGELSESLIQQSATLPVSKILVANAAVYQHQLAENMALLMADLGKAYDYVLSAATTFGKNILPRAAALLDVSMVADVTKIIAPDTFERPMYAGNITATIQSFETIKILTIRTTAFAAVAYQATKVPLETVDKIFPNELSHFDTESLTVSERPELTSARVIISGGRGFKSAENFKLLETLADRLGAAIGASRAAVDAGFAPNDYQVGQTGKIVAPDLYIAIGISGAIQHLAGMKESKVVVAINNDPDAPIFQHADYGLVGDLFKILPELTTELSK